MSVFERLANEKASEYAYRYLRKNIIGLEFTPNSRICEADIAKELGLSRTPVIVYPQKGSFVSKIDYNLVEESRFVRLVLEKAIIDIVCDKPDDKFIDRLEINIRNQKYYLDKEDKTNLMQLDNEFHKILFEMANKLQTHELVESISGHFDRLRNLSINTIKDIKTVSDHEKIFSAIKSCDSFKAKELMEIHLSRHKFEEKILREKFSDYFD